MAMFLLAGDPEINPQLGSFFSRLAEISKKHKRNTAGPIICIMFYEVATLVHLIEPSKPKAR